MPEFYICSESALYTDAKWDFQDVSDMSGQYVEIRDYIRMVKEMLWTRCSNCSTEEIVENIFVEPKLSSLSSYYQYVGMLANSNKNLEKTSVTPEHQQIRL